MKKGVSFFSRYRIKGMKRKQQKWILIFFAIGVLLLLGSFFLFDFSVDEGFKSSSEKPPSGKSPSTKGSSGKGPATKASVKLSPSSSPSSTTVPKREALKTSRSESEAASGTSEAASGTTKSK